MWPAYRWVDVLGRTGKPLVVRSRGLGGFDSPTAVEFAWQASEGKGRKTGPVIQPGFRSGNPPTYHPMDREHAALFRIFAGLDYTDRQAIGAFATKYGLLGASPESHGPESHLTWAREICLMREALKLSKAPTPTSEAREREIWASYDAETRARWNTQGLDQDPAEFRHREDRQKLAWLFNLHLQRVQPRIAFDQNSSPGLTFAPLTLLAAMWLQFALALVGDKKFPECKFCRRLFEISTEKTGFRSHREFCSDSCKTMDYRKRKRTALQLATKGWSIQRVAKTTNTATSTVRDWVRLMKHRKNAITAKKRRA